MPYFVYSTMSTNVNYAFYGESVNNLPSVERVIMIEGGANVATKNLITPKGVATEVSAEELALLENHPIFKRNRAAGFIAVEKYETNPDRVASNMTARDESAPLIDGDFAEAADVEVSTSKNGKKITNKK